MFSDAAIAEAEDSFAADGYLVLPGFFSAGLSDQVQEVVERVKGSGQDPHVDSLYMTRRTPLHLIAIWVALEDSHPDSGPLDYIPGRHKLAPYRFSDGGFHGIDAEMPDWRAAMDQAAAQAGLERHVFLAKKGDVFIWHAHLLHGGSPIRDPARTHKSYVFHYVSESDARAAGARSINRPPQPVSVANGDFPDAKTHYEIFGRNKGRLPYERRRPYTEPNRLKDPRHGRLPVCLRHEGPHESLSGRARSF
jgi:ectoine hydroxylase-related dioxygenase (phytanoyl-CoA dioxygenase family)